MKKIAIIPARGIGDGLIGLVVAENIRRNGYQVTAYSNILSQLDDWFPHIHITPKKNLSKETLVQYEQVIFLDALVDKAHQHLPNAIYFQDYKSTFDKQKHYLRNLATFTENLGYQWHTDHNGIQPPAYLQPKKHAKRICIHPTSTDAEKNWDAKKFITLSHKLAQQGFDVTFIVSPTEKSEWEAYDIHLLAEPSLSKVAAYLYESAAVIGNDSGIGHLGSNLGLPVISIFGRKSKSIYWHPIWSRNIIVLPWLRFPKKLLRKHWQKFVSVARVYRVFISSLFGKR